MVALTAWFVVMGRKVVLGGEVEAGVARYIGESGRSGYERGLEAWNTWRDSARVRRTVTCSNTS